MASYACLPPKLEVTMKATQCSVIMWFWKTAISFRFFCKGTIFVDYNSNWKLTVQLFCCMKRGLSETWLQLSDFQTSFQPAHKYYIYTIPALNHTSLPLCDVRIVRLILLSKTSGPTVAYLKRLTLWLMRNTKTDSLADEKMNMNPRLTLLSLGI